MFRNQTLDEELLVSDVELSLIEDEIREIRELIDGWLITPLFRQASLFLKEIVQNAEKDSPCRVRL